MKIENKNAPSKFVQPIVKPKACIAELLSQRTHLFVFISQQPINSFVIKVPMSSNSSVLSPLSLA